MCKKYSVRVSGLAAVLMLSGCNQIGLPDLTTTGAIFGSPQQAAFSHTITEARPLAEALVHFPQETGEALELTQTRFGNGVEQLVVYRGDNGTRGENAARIQLVVPASRFGNRSEDLAIDKISHRLIAAEMRKALPGISMAISNEMNANAYGVFGYALGRASGTVNCIYGWQAMSGSGNDRWAPLFGDSSKRKLSIRLRVCRSGASASQLVELMRNLRVDDNPDRALRETSVSWRSGSGEQLSTAMPSYEPGGYASQPVAAAVEPVRAETEPVKPLRKAEKKSPRVEPVAKVAPAQNSTVATRSTRVYSPPLPETTTQPSVPAVAPEVPKLPEVIARSEVSASHSPLVPVPQVATAPSALAASYTSPVAPGTVGLVDTATTVGDLVPLPD